MFRTIVILASIVGASAFAPAGRMAVRSSLKMGYETEVRYIHEYFATSIEPGTERLLSEDYHFCHIWRKIDGKVFAAPWAELSHIGTYAFEGRLTPAA